MPLFGTLIALSDERNGAVIAGMIDMPALAERWYGTPSGTTFNRRAGQSEPRRQSGRSADLHVVPDFFSPEDWARYDRSAARPCSDDLAAIAINTAFWPQGIADLVVECSLKSFDFMALVPVIEGAGGVICDWEACR